MMGVLIPHREILVVMKMTSNKFCPCEEDISPKYLLAEMGGILYKVDQRRKKGSNSSEEINCVGIFRVCFVKTQMLM